MSETRSTEPNSPLTELAQVALDALPDTEGLRAIVFLTQGENGGIAIGGYDDTAAIGDLLVHLRSMLRVNGQDLHVVKVPRPGGRDHAV